MHIATTFDTYMELENNDLESALDRIKQDGFDALGIVVTEPISYYREMIPKLKQSGLKFCVHANLVDTNLASSNKGIRQESIKQVKEAIDLAIKLGAKVVTFHPGKFRNTFHIQEAYMLLDLSIKELLEYTEQINVTLCIENMEPRHKELCVSAAQTNNVLKRHPGLMLTLDLAHVAMKTDSVNDILDYYRQFKDRIRHFHISGNKPNKSHVEVSLNESGVDFSEVIREITDFSGILRIENRERKKNIESLEFIKNIINQE